MPYGIPVLTDQIKAQTIYRQTQTEYQMAKLLIVEGSVPEPFN